MFEWLIPLLISIAVFLLASAGQRWWRELRLRRLALAVVKTSVPDGDMATSRRSPIQDFFFRLLPILAAWQKQWVPTAWAIKVEKQLDRQPLWSGRTAAQWLVTKELSALVGGLAGFFIEAGIFYSLLIAVAAFFLPDFWLKEKGTARRKGIMRELPDSLDLLASCMEAGLGFEQAVGVILERSKKGFLYQELNEMMRSVRMGRSRRDALKAMGERVGDSDFTTFITSLVQAERLGVSVAKTLKQQAVQLRTKRSQSIEKQALEAPVKLLFPLVVFVFPVVFLVLFGPIVIRFMQGF
jgi:Flp pilus assembly protein TadB